jgi:methionyl-tRNA formyltransferase
MGTPELAAEVLRAILDAGYNVTGVVTQPDRAKGRKKTPVMCPVKELAVREGLRVFQPQKVRLPEAVEEVRSMEPDVIVVAAFGQILPKSLLDIPKFGCINVHASLLPEYRGAAPIQQAILDGKEETGVTIMRMDEGLDTGDMISKRTVPISGEDTGGSLTEKLSKAGAELLVETLPGILNGEAVYTPQPACPDMPYVRTIKKEQGRIDWNEDADSICRKVRAYSPWPSAFTEIDGNPFKIWRAHTGQSFGEGKPGEIAFDADGHMAVRTGEGMLYPDEVQIAGKKRMPVSDFLRGYKVSPESMMGRPEVE